MPDLPEYMLKLDKPEDQDFGDKDEHLYRRVPPILWDDDDIDLDAIEFPDMSVTRERYGRRADSARWVGDKYHNWGVIQFKVADIPPEIPFQGAVIYRLKPVHAPLKKNYPHSEVRAYEAKWESPDRMIHIDKAKMSGVPLEAQQEWRELLRRRSEIALRPTEEQADAG